MACGYSPGLGFIHTGKQLSFVYDVADLYKVDLTVPVAFEAAGAGEQPTERAVRLRMRDAFGRVNFLERVVKDIEYAMGAALEAGMEEEADFDGDAAAPGGLWDPTGTVEGGQNFADPPAREGNGDDRDPG